MNPQQPLTRKNPPAWLIPLALLLLFLSLRLPGLGRFVTTDEHLWLARSANFYLALQDRDWPGTFQSEHPGITTQWAGAIGYQIAFPAYARVGTPDIHDAQLRQLMVNRGVNPMQVLSASRSVIVVFNALAFIALWPLARRLLGEPVATLGLALIAFDPFLIAHQRLLHLDGLLASFMLLSVLAYCDFVRTRNVSSLLVSGLAAGLSWLTKTPGWFLLPVIGGITGWDLWRSQSQVKARMHWLLALFIWGLSGSALLFLLFPAMWAAPINTLQQMAQYALGSAAGEYGGPIFFNGQVYPDGDMGALGWIFYPLSFLWRSTPLTVLGLLLAAGLAIRARRRKEKIQAFPVLALLFYALAFILLMSLGEKKFDRYVLAAHAPLVLIAAWGWLRLTESFAWFRQHATRATAVLLTVVTLQAASALPTYPYYLSYYNPLLGGAAKAPDVMMIGWGEGLDQAARFLNARSDIEAGNSAAWYSNSFNLIFSWEADDIPIALELEPEQLNALLAEDYLVIYVHQWQRGTPQNLLDALDGMSPVHIVQINGIEYVRVYQMHER
jgi:hypothetical protein